MSQNRHKGNEVPTEQSFLPKWYKNNGPPMSYLSLSTYKTQFDERTNYLLLEKNKNYMLNHQTFCTIFMYKQFLIVTKVKSSSGDSRLIGSTITLNVCILGTEAVWRALQWHHMILLFLLSSTQDIWWRHPNPLDDVTQTGPTEDVALLMTSFLKYLTTSLWLR